MTMRAYSARGRASFRSGLYEQPARRLQFEESLYTVSGTAFNCNNVAPNWYLIGIIIGWRIGRYYIPIRCTLT